MSNSALLQQQQQQLLFVKKIPNSNQEQHKNVSEALRDFHDFHMCTF